MRVFLPHDTKHVYLSVVVYLFLLFLIFKVVDCQMSRWSSWTTCSNPCGRGRKERGRVVLAKAKNGGKRCPKKTSRWKGCRGRNCSGKYAWVTCVSQWALYISGVRSLGHRVKLNMAVNGRPNLFQSPYAVFHVYVYSKKCEGGLKPDTAINRADFRFKRSVLRRQSRDTNRNIKRSVYCQYGF